MNGVHRKLASQCPGTNNSATSIAVISPIHSTSPTPRLRLRPALPATGRALHAPVPQLLSELAVACTDRRTRGGSSRPLDRIASW